MAFLPLLPTSRSFSSNRSQAHLLLDNFASAYRDTCAVLSLLISGVDAPAQTKLKATLRQARALEGLRKLEMALEAYEAVSKLEGPTAEGKDGTKRVEKMLRESKTGEFEWRKLEKGNASGESSASVGDFFGPIQVVEIAGRGGGRGVIATRDIAAGGTILGAYASSSPAPASPSVVPKAADSHAPAVEKAFATGRPSKTGPLTLMVLNLHLNKAEKASDVALTQSVVSRILDDPSTAPLVYSLYGGPNHLPHSTAPIGSLAQRKVSKVHHFANVDIARIEGLITQNA
jgi:hypothetical protein